MCVSNVSYVSIIYINHIYQSYVSIICIIHMYQSYVSYTCINHMYHMCHVYNVSRMYHMYVYVQLNCVPMFMHVYAIWHMMCTLHPCFGRLSKLTRKNIPRCPSSGLSRQNFPRLTVHLARGWFDTLVFFWHDLFRNCS